jgi:hypothetical protein
MSAISAADSVSPAIQRTKEFLFKPFSWGTYLKLGLVAIITEGTGRSFRSSSHGGHPLGPGPTIHSPFHLTPEWCAMIVAAVLAAIPFFHCLIHNTKEIRPGWRLYRMQATRFFWMNIVVGLGFLLLVVLVALPFVEGFWRLIRETPPGGHPDVGLLLALVLPLIPIILLLALAGILTDVILRDLMLPHYALENATAGEAWISVWDRILDEKRQFAVYALLRVVLPVIAGIGLFIVLIIPGLIVLGSFAVFEYGIHSAFADATGAAAVIGVVIQGFFGLIAFGLMLLASICLGGPLSTGIREYALIFYGGRYQALGEILYPSSPTFHTKTGQ